MKPCLWSYFAGIFHSSIETLPILFMPNVHVVVEELQLRLNWHVKRGILLVGWKKTQKNTFRSWQHDFFQKFFWWVFIIHTIPTTLHCEKNDFENIFFVENSPVQPLAMTQPWMPLPEEAGEKSACAIRKWMSVVPLLLVDQPPSFVLPQWPQTFPNMTKLVPGCTRCHKTGEISTINDSL